MINRNKKIIGIVFLALLLAFAQDSFSDYEEELDRAHDYMYTDYERAIKICSEILSKNPELARAHWIKSIAYTNLGDLQSSEENRERYYEKAQELADRALELDPDDPDANHAKAIVLGRMAERAGAREGLRLSREVKRYTDRVLELDEEHAGAWFVRGLLIYRIDTLGRIERWVANSLFGGLPFDADQEKAIEALAKAVELSPKSIYFRLEFGKVLKDYGKKSRAEAILEAALELEPVTPKDDDHLEEAEKLLGEL